jgi:hypothetical protein
MDAESPQHESQTRILAGLLALKWLSRWLESGRWYLFGIYCLIASAVIFYLHTRGFWSIFGMHIVFLRTVKGSFFLRKSHFAMCLRSTPIPKMP